MWESRGLGRCLFQLCKCRRSALPLASSGARGEESNTSTVLRHNNTTRQTQLERCLCRSAILPQRKTSSVRRSRLQHHHGQSTFHQQSWPKLTLLRFHSFTLSLFSHTCMKRPEFSFDLSFDIYLHLDHVCSSLHPKLIIQSIFYYAHVKHHTHVTDVSLMPDTQLVFNGNLTKSKSFIKTVV